MYELRRTGTSPGEIGLYADLLSAVFPTTHHFNADFLTWQYKLNPLGPVVGFDAWSGRELAAHYVTIPVQFAIAGRLTKGLLSLNTATRPDHQGKGLFTSLATKTYELARALGYEFVVGVANQNSTPGFLKKLGFSLIGPLDVKIGIGRVRSKPRSAYALNPIWSDEHLRWRLRNPSRTYRARGGNVFARTGTMGISAVLCLNRSLPGRAARIPALGLQTWIGIDRNVRFSGIFIDLPERFRPSPLNCIFKDLGNGHPVFAHDDVRFELIDFDAY
jgi:GNAT superfamily N-acetyltransferase